MVKAAVTPPATESSVPGTEVLTIDELAPATGIVRIDGETYDLADTRLFGLRRRAELHQLVKRIEVLESMDPEQISDADEAEYEKRLRTVAAIALPTATAVLGKLGKEKIGDIVIAFFGWAASTDPRMRMLNKLTSGRPSPGSSGSTAATR